MNLSELDIRLFFWINQGQRNSFFDLVMPFITEFDNWKYLLLISWIILFLFGGKKMKITLFLLAVLVGVLDYSNSFFFKHLFGRIRPCNALTEIHAFGACPGSLSFPSNHAANIFGAAFFLSYIFRRWSYFMLPIAVVVGYSRIYVGEHYPFDVLGGIFLGAIGAGLFLWAHHLWLSSGKEQSRGSSIKGR